MFLPTTRRTQMPVTAHSHHLLAFWFQPFKGSLQVPETVYMSPEDVLNIKRRPHGPFWPISRLPHDPKTNRCAREPFWCSSPVKSRSPPNFVRVWSFLVKERSCENERFRRIKELSVRNPLFSTTKRLSKGDAPPHEQNSPSPRTA